MILNETYPLANGVQVPKLGLGTWFIDDAEAAEAVREAVKLGYRLIDTAQATETNAASARACAPAASPGRAFRRQQDRGRAEDLRGCGEVHR